MIELRDYQQQLADEIRDEYRFGRRAVLAQAPTGAGKTVLLAYIAQNAALKQKKTCILVHRQELVTQTAIALASGGIEHNICAPAGVIKASIKAQMEASGKSLYRYEASVTIAAVQTLVHRMADYHAFDFLMIDESHHSVAGTWRSVIDAYPKSQILGVTATPERLDGRGLGVDCGGIFDSLVAGPSVQNLIDRGFLSRPRVFAPPMQMSLEGIKLIGGDYSKKELDARVNKIPIIGDAITHYSKLCEEMPAIAFCVNIDHARKVAEQFKEAGYRAACIDGKMDDYSRRAAINSLASGNLHVLTSCEIISEGTDIPVVGAVILLRPTQSLGLYMQQVGRGLRPYPGKEYTVILDHVGNVARHGLPEEDRTWTLDGRRKKGSSKRTEGPPSRQCLNCYAIYPTSVDACPQCGHLVPKSKQEIQQIEAELIEITEQEAKKQMRKEEGMAKNLRELIELGKRRGYQYPVAWAKNKLRGRRQ